MKTVREESALIISMVGALVSRVTPSAPLSDDEKGMLQPPLEMVLYKHGGSLPCEWQLVIACGMIAAPRYFLIRAQKKGPDLAKRE